MKVLKRNGKEAPFDITKIHNAVDKAFLDVRRKHPPKWLVAKYEEHFTQEYENSRLFGIEEIQNTVEEILMHEGFYDVARSYILYRESHREERTIKERIEYAENYISGSENAASSSETDPNANVSIKNVANLNGELWKTQNRKMQRNFMRKKLKKMFPQYELAYAQDLERHIIYTHDESSCPVPIPYCSAYSMYPFMEHGSGNMDGLGTKKPEHLSSFCGQFDNLMFLFSSQVKGAVAVAELWNCMDYVCAKDWGDGYHGKMEDVIVLEPRMTRRQVLHQYFQQIVYTINQPQGNRCSQSPFTNVSYYDANYWKALFEDFRFPDGSRPVWERVSFLQKEFMLWFNKERSKTLVTFPVETMALLSDGKDIIDKEYKDFTASMYAQGHSFFTYISDNPDSLSSCCRLRNKIQDNVFSFTNGLTGVQTGSCNVITLNHNRIIQDWARENGYDREYLKEHFFDHKDSYAAYLENILERVYAYHIAYKTMLYESERKGMFTASNAGYISIQKLYSTIGDNGVNEAAEFVGLQCSYNDSYRDFCRLVTGTISRQNKLHSTDRRFIFNQEFVPAESLSSKNYNWDREDGYWVPGNRVLYNSYFYLADDPGTTVLDKFRLHGREFTELLDGGVGLHCNLEEHLSKEQYLKLIDFAIANGTSYFTFNIPNSECTNAECGHIVKQPLHACPKCGSPMRQWTRIIGYLRPVDNFDKYRKIEASTRHYSRADEKSLQENK